eukprot:TRINITY_DN10800_c0_g1_i2.p2 TRINITY_DN10800_c0_g1~~TRINITY_DN10800_c0_g1_i2.p2  ORF type:complete len:118 (+),score=65.87 TRINITY_DN10800_c0_g1_i2:50-355(+)
MQATLVKVWVKPGTEAAFIRATQKNAAGSVQEAGCLRFDFLQSKADPTHFTLLEVYEKPEQVLAHKDTAHYKEWRAAVADMMAKPREGVKFTGLFVPKAKL